MLSQSFSAPSAGERVLDLAHPKISERIETDHASAFDFVRLTVAQVDNPKRVGLSFDVAFIGDRGTQVQLGGFSLYPPDNPGSFLVSTRHSIDSSGFVVVTLHTVTPVDAGTRLTVTISAVTLTNGL